MATFVPRRLTSFSAGSAARCSLNPVSVTVVRFSRRISSLSNPASAVEVYNSTFTIHNLGTMDLSYRVDDAIPITLSALLYVTFVNIF